MENQNTIGAQFKALNILHIALCSGIIIISVVFRFLAKQNPEIPEKNMAIEIAGIAVGFVCVLAARLMFFSRTKEALKTSSLKEKIDIYRAAFILQIALLEGAAIINAVFYFITKDDIHFFIAIGIILLMIVRRPTRAMAAMTLFSDMEDKQVVYDDSMPL